ncbi:MAG: TorF family putative porin [Steroidobacteraceae bacterium]
MKPRQLLPLLAMLAIAAARAEVSSTFTLASDYDFRGITQSALDPALQASLDWSQESGFYASLWGSNVDFGTGTDIQVEIDRACRLQLRLVLAAG